MGGSAFLTGNFPRLSPALYHSFKDRHTAVLKTLYTLVATPIEAPEKVDHGDVDFIVWKESDLPSHDTVKTALGATMVNPMDGPRTSNYAVALPGDDNYYQVDVHVCAAEEEFHRTMFFHSYGDMGMILGLIARGVGLHLGVHGLRVKIQKTFSLDDSLICNFSILNLPILPGTSHPSLMRSYHFLDGTSAAMKRALQRALNCTNGSLHRHIYVPKCSRRRIRLAK